MICQERIMNLPEFFKQALPLDSFDMILVQEMMPNAILFVGDHRIQTDVFNAFEISKSFVAKPKVVIEIIQ